MFFALLAGCSNGQDAKLLATPEVGDLYASELTHFAEFDQEGRAYGLMKVVAVTDDAITVATDSTAWPAPSGAKNDLHGDLSGVKWDMVATIRIARSELPELYRQDRIFGVRRPGPASKENQ
jgi:hypothetical protein